jgi:hypothetical protein
MRPRPGWRRWGAVGQPAAAVTGEHPDVADALRGKAPPGLAGQARPAFDADPSGRQAGQQHCLITRAGADLKHMATASQAQALDHPGH